MNRVKTLKIHEKTHLQIISAGGKCTQKVVKSTASHPWFLHSMHCMYALHSCMYATMQWGLEDFSMQNACILRFFVKMQEMHGKSQDFSPKMHSYDEKLVKCIAF